MASAPPFKLFNPGGEYLGSLKYVEDAAAMVAILGDGATVRNGHAKRDTIYTQGADGDAGESYDVAGELMRSRIAARRHA